MCIRDSVNSVLNCPREVERRHGGGLWIAGQRIVRDRDIEVAERSIRRDLVSVGRGRGVGDEADRGALRSNARKRRCHGDVRVLGKSVGGFAGIAGEEDRWFAECSELAQLLGPGLAPGARWLDDAMLDYIDAYQPCRCEGIDASECTWLNVELSIASCGEIGQFVDCLLYTSPSPRDLSTSRMPSSA